jgi:hypothetical protein
MAAAGLAAVTGWLLRPVPAVSGGAISTLGWAAAQAPLPGNAALDSSSGAALDDVACPAVGSCIAVGSYPLEQGGKELFKPLVETLSHGTWTAGTVAGVAADEAWLTGIACPAPDSCVAVGDYLAPRDHPITATLSDGSWTVTDMPQPRNGNPSTNAYLSDVVCPAQGKCIATGNYTDQNGNDEPLIETLSGGKWSAVSAPLPAGAAPVKAVQQTNTFLYSAACPTADSCITVGQYTVHGGSAEPFIETLSGGKWTPATVPLPGDAATARPGGLFGISCVAADECLAVGQYEDRSAQARSLVETRSGSTWTATAPPLPGDAAAAQKWNKQLSNTGLEAVACQALGACTANGSYTTGNGALVGMIDTLSSGKWTTMKAPLPSGAATTKQHSFFSATLCPAPGNCVAVGAYESADGITRALIETYISKQG